jgi:hypothetical protein
MGALLRKSIESDINTVSDNLRHEDTIEVLAQGYKNTKSALSESYNASTLRFTLENNGKPIAMFGICPVTILGDKARIWLLGTKDIELVKKSFCQYSLIMVKCFLKMYPILIAQVDGRYAKTHRWLEWLGAEKSEPYKLKDGVEFNNFIFERSA